LATSALKMFMDAFSAHEHGLLLMNFSREQLFLISYIILVNGVTVSISFNMSGIQ